MTESFDETSQAYNNIYMKAEDPEEADVSSQLQNQTNKDLENNKEKSASRLTDLEEKIFTLEVMCKAKDDHIQHLQKYKCELEETNDKLNSLIIKQKETMKELQNNMKEYQMKYRKEEADNNLLKSAITELYDTIEKKDLEISDIKNEKQRIESDNAKILQKICELNELLETTNKNTSKKTYQRSSAELKQLTMNTKYNKQIIKDRRPLQMINDNIDSTLDLLPKKRSLSQLNTCDNKNKSMIINRQSVNNPIIIEDDKENENEPASFNKKTKTINTKIEKSSTTPSNINIPPSVTNSRHHHDRSNMKGSTCISCANFYGNETLSVQLNNEEIHLTGQDRVQLHSRHRRQRATTPPGFWSVGFASPPEKE